MSRSTDMTGRVSPESPERESSAMSALVLEAPGVVRERRIPVAPPSSGNCLIRISRIGLCGTDLGFYDGSSNYLHDGLKSFPFVFGHEWCGRIVETGSGVVGFDVGQRVSGHNFRPCGNCPACGRGDLRYCPGRSEIGVLGQAQGAAADYLEAPADTLVRIPDSLGDDVAALLEPASAALHAVRRLAVTGADRVAVLGAGTLGVVAAQLCRALGARVDVFDPQPEPRELAAELGFPVSVPENAEADRYSAVIEASGSVAAARSAPVLCAPGARMAQLGTPHHSVDGFPVADLVIKNVTMHAVLSGIGCWEELITFVESGLVRLDPLVDSAFSRSEVGAAFQRLASSGRRRPKILIRMS
ncbi:alcohol dehydrogenase catalytic domain-containing protein [Saccharopolyspora gregorii]|uniref:Alcohol dehydrogenase catalytic domain-containing protein n=2 Tax=Saccharopolyspora gregorii TaxID=33914 RepID=A0ABP6RHX0_9PSEU|nr:alcohol dehydrogenase catalytic domain-containing protein [Saccharopolyspora gregorii]